MSRRRRRRRKRRNPAGRLIALVLTLVVISVIMGAEDKAFLYQEMNRLLEAEKALSE